MKTLSQKFLFKGKITQPQNILTLENFRLCGKLAHRKGKNLNIVGIMQNALL